MRQTQVPQETIKAQQVYSTFISHLISYSHLSLSLSLSLSLAFSSPAASEFDSSYSRFLGRFLLEPLRENPLFGPSSRISEKLGALEWTKVVHKHHGWRRITCIWLHAAGVIHLLTNMLCLIFIVIRLEQQFGFVRIGIIYLVSGFGGSVLSSLFIRNSISVGASDALFGLLGAMLSELITNWTLYTNKAAALLTFLVIIVINLVIGILPHLDNFAHNLVIWFCFAALSSIWVARS
ncbi:hypothetical protein LWI28_028072 [Acer negundo]|uniref:RHOMBOID-like protein n=1 Tax=Acer negundo TaxID=4023 RepID=A0AAD5NUB2_ACENE|nr:hypothetical protein LWI28_028072 [Acer negundo]